MTPRVVLVAEDEPALQSSLSAFLTLNGFQTFKASEFEEALEILARERIDAVTLDIRVPDGSGMQRNGLTLLNALRNNPKYRKMPVVVFTGIPLSPEDEQHVQHLGAAVIYKPQSLSVILECLTRLFDPRR